MGEKVGQCLFPDGSPVGAGTIDLHSNGEGSVRRVCVRSKASVRSLAEAL